jgi:pyridoxamine 5'-phosphate oxidase
MLPPGGHVETFDPFSLFSDWLKEAEKIPGIIHPNAMQIATASTSGMPSIRTVLLKGFSAAGFNFYTNFESQKGRELSANPEAALCFYWDPLGRQVRVAGAVSRLSAEESESYFWTRPRTSQLGAWASHQGQEIPSREYLEDKVKEFEKKFAKSEKIPLPPHWGGFRLSPTRFEFWQAAEHRLHHRAAYELRGASWHHKILSP